MSNRPVLQLFVKHPKAGQTKTRLAAGIGHRKALIAYQRLLERAKAMATDLQQDFDIEIWYGNEIPEQDLWATTGWPRHQQWGEDIGQRMNHAMTQALDRGAEKVLLMGTDLPAMNQTLVREAFTLLDDHPAVMGPAIDGGYYLVGLRAALPALFADIEWSTSTVYAESCARFRAAGWTWAELPALSDLDTVDDLPGTLLEDLLPAKAHHPLLLQVTGYDMRTLTEVAEVVATHQDDPEMFDVLIDGMFVAQEATRYKAADAAEKIARLHPDWLQAHGDRLFGSLTHLVHDKALEMSLPIMLGRLHWKDEQLGIVMDALQKWLARASNKFVQVFLLQALTDQAILRPALIPEVLATVTAHMEAGSAAIRARGRKLLKALEKAQ